MDRLTLRGISAVGRHGVLPAEREHGQRFVVDVVLGFDTAPAAAADDLALSVDYAQVAARVERAISSEPVDLIETLAQRLAEVCLDEQRVEWVEVTVHKPAAPLPVECADVAVTIQRSRR